MLLNSYPNIYYNHWKIQYSEQHILLFINIFPFKKIFWCRIHLPHTVTKISF